MGQGTIPNAKRITHSKPEHGNMDTARDHDMSATREDPANSTSNTRGPASKSDLDNGKGKGDRDTCA